MDWIWGDSADSISGTYQIGIGDKDPFYRMKYARQPFSGLQNIYEILSQYFNKDTRGLLIAGSIGIDS